MYITTLHQRPDTCPKLYKINTCRKLHKINIFHSFSFFLPSIAIKLHVHCNREEITRSKATVLAPLRTSDNDLSKEILTEEDIS